ncbi:hypothetical protein ACIB24_17225 [Spongisporangium articulatum]|uniref:Resolvase/invertase-type recombinase catalytic domain-containing protein n=1 Tax=Spongisporangium articulatum TaxID=3362603 RepID=A0ABW8AT84_9ACTN
MARPAPLAVGLVRAAPRKTMQERFRGKVRFGAWALKEGYALVETFEVSSAPAQDAKTIGAVRDLVDRCSIPTLIVMDDVPEQAVDRVRVGHELRVLTVAPELVETQR